MEAGALHTLVRCESFDPISTPVLMDAHSHHRSARNSLQVRHHTLYEQQPIGYSYIEDGLTRDGVLLLLPLGLTSWQIQPCSAVA